MLAAEKYDDAAMPLNIGTGIGTSIRELVETINSVTGYAGQLSGTLTSRTERQRRSST